MPNSWDDWLDSAAQNPVNAAIQRAGWKRPVRAPRPQVPTPNDFVGAEPPDITDEQRSKIFDETEWSRSGSSPYDVMRTIKEQGETSDPDGPSFMDEYDAAVKRAQADRPGMKEYVNAKDAAEHATRMQAFAPTPDPNYRRGGSPPPPDRSNEMTYEAAPRMDFSQVDANRGSADRAQAEEAAARLRRIQGLGYGATPPPPPPQRTMETPSEATRPDFLQRAKPGEFGYQSMKGSPGEMSGPLGTSYPHWSGAQEIPYGKEQSLQENPVGLDPARPRADFAQHTNFGESRAERFRGLPGGDTYREDAHSMQSSLDALGARKEMSATKAKALDQDWAEANPEAAARGEHELPGNRTFLDMMKYGTSRQALGVPDEAGAMTLMDRLYKTQTEAKASEEAKKAAEAEKLRQAAMTPEQRDAAGHAREDTRNAFLDARHDKERQQELDLRQNERGDAAAARDAAAAHERTREQEVDAARLKEEDARRGDAENAREAGLQAEIRREQRAESRSRLTAQDKASENDRIRAEKFRLWTERLGLKTQAALDEYMGKVGIKTRADLDAEIQRYPNGRPGRTGTSTAYPISRDFLRQQAVEDEAALERINSEVGSNPGFWERAIGPVAGDFRGATHDFRVWAHKDALDALRVPWPNRIDEQHDLLAKLIPNYRTRAAMIPQGVPASSPVSSPSQLANSEEISNEDIDEIQRD